MTVRDMAGCRKSCVLMQGGQAKPTRLIVTTIVRKLRSNPKPAGGAYELSSREEDAEAEGEGTPRIAEERRPQRKKIGAAGHERSSGVDGEAEGGAPSSGMRTPQRRLFLIAAMFLLCTSSGAIFLLVGFGENRDDDAPGQGASLRAPAMASAETAAMTPAETKAALAQAENEVVAPAETKAAEATPAETTAVLAPAETKAALAPAKTEAVAPAEAEAVLGWTADVDLCPWLNATLYAHGLGATAAAARQTNYMSRYLHLLGQLQGVRLQRQAVGSPRQRQAALAQGLNETWSVTRKLVHAHAHAEFNGLTHGTLWHLVSHIPWGEQQNPGDLCLLLHQQQEGGAWSTHCGHGTGHGMMIRWAGLKRYAACNEGGHVFGDQAPSLDIIVRGIHTARGMNNGQTPLMASQAFAGFLHPIFEHMTRLELATKSEALLGAGYVTRETQWMDVCVAISSEATADQLRRCAL